MCYEDLVYKLLTIIVLTICIMALIWKAPFTCLISGPSGCGKSEFAIRLIENSTKVISPPPQKIIWCYGTYQRRFETLSNIDFIEGMPDLTMFDGRSHILLILNVRRQQRSNSHKVIYSDITPYEREHTIPDAKFVPRRKTKPNCIIKLTLYGTF